VPKFTEGKNIKQKNTNTTKTVVSARGIEHVNILKKQ